MRDVFLIADNITTPLGKTTEENFKNLRNGISGIRQYDDKDFSAIPFYASIFNRYDNLSGEGAQDTWTKFEQMLILSIKDAIGKSGTDLSGKDSIFILSSTKGNISLLDTQQPNNDLRKRLTLSASAQMVAGYFNFVNPPLVVSNACISGMLALLTGMRLIQTGQYAHAVVAGADVISKFVLSGFQSFQAISEGPCKPFDISRSGINLGEGAATIILSSSEQNLTSIKLAGGSVSNDANHISGPSRTGEELFQAIRVALLAAGLFPQDIDFISAHGTATLFNDEMEARAITLADMQTVPVNSLKGYFGHTLGAAGLIESIISCRSLQENLLLPTKGYAVHGVSTPLNICRTVQKGEFYHCLKTASGFGGCNAALIFSKQQQ